MDKSVNIVKMIDELTYDDITDADVELVEDLMSMGAGAWDMVNHRELVWACFKVVYQEKFQKKH
jgi:hypothetical protein